MTKVNVAKSTDFGTYHLVVLEFCPDFLETPYIQVNSKSSSLRFLAYTHSHTRDRLIWYFWGIVKHFDVFECIWRVLFEYFKAFYGIFIAFWHFQDRYFWQYCESYFHYYELCIDVVIIHFTIFLHIKALLKYLNMLIIDWRFELWFEPFF